MLGLVFLIGGIASIWYGWVLLSDKRKIWKRYEARMKRFGINTERTSEWDETINNQGLLSIVFGFILLALFICQA